MTTARPSTPSLPRSLPRRTAAVLAAAVALLAAGPMAASAHVRVQADSTASGSFAALTFRVPDEADHARTVKVAVDLPQDKPFLSVSTKPVPGWRVVVARATLPKPVAVEGTTITEAARTVTWTAVGAGIEPGQYQEFAVSVGPLPGPGTVLLPATQTYSDGTVVRWDQPTPASGEEPEHPAPALVVVAAASAPARADDRTARLLGGLGLGVGVVGVALAGWALRRRPAAAA